MVPRKVAVDSLDAGFFLSERSDGSARPMIPAQCFPA